MPLHRYSMPITRADGLIYLPEIKYRRVLNRAFGPGAWGLAPRSETNVGPRIVSREYALVCHGRFAAMLLHVLSLSSIFAVDSLQSPAASRSTLTHLGSPPPPRPARAMPSCGAPKTLVSRANSGALSSLRRPCLPHLDQGSAVHPRVQGKTLRRSLCGAPPDKEKVGTSFRVIVLLSHRFYRRQEEDVAPQGPAQAQLPVPRMSGIACPLVYTRRLLTPLIENIFACDFLLPARGRLQILYSF